MTDQENLKKSYLDFLTDVDENIVLFKNAEHYVSVDWRPFKFLDVCHPIQRKLTTRECVFDFDGVTDTQVDFIITQLTQFGLKFNAWRSSSNGLHVHFWTDVRGKMAKKSLVRLFAQKLETILGIKNDLQPMMQEMIRSEWSIHPKKGVEMILIHDNIPRIDPINIIPDEIKKKVISNYDDGISGRGLTGSRKGELPSCMRYIMSHKFTDGRKRLLFVVLSWFKGSGFSDGEVVDATYEWCVRQGLKVSKGHLRRILGSNTGSVGCRYRHELLETLGIDINCTK